MNNALFKSEQWQHIVFNITLITFNIQGLKCGIKCYRMASNGIKRPNFHDIIIIERGSESRATQGTANAREQPQSASKHSANSGADEPKRRKSQRQQRRQGDKPKQTKAAGSKPQRQAGRQTNAREKHSRRQRESAAIRPGTESKHRSNERIMYI